MAKRTRTPAKKPQAAKPGFISPQLATLKMKAPSGVQWIHEVKYDGYRVQLHIDGDDRKAFTRNGHNWVNRFSVIAGAFNIAGQAIVDGEVVVIHEGRTNFSELQADLGRGDQDRLVYFAFDLLWLDGKDLRRMAQLARKELLKQLIDENGLEAPIFYSEHHESDGQALFEAASKLNYEGIVSKRVDAPYRSERVEAWQKIKTVQREKFPVVGFVKDPSGVAALYLGKQEGNELRYMGKVGTGWSRTKSAEIRKALDTVLSPKQKLTKRIEKPKATWVEPKFYADIEYRDITSEGLLRASSFKGLSKK
ncbi:non-homologous end-joining DNA ligase [Bradyrhizobium canariense]|uniref:non-homologous end-joining DNA ligase n=3 Tax=Bradyrhizobium canariense TaxID=255045 RepID=UPI000A18C18E|nr:non-homologous end-joining DNA ligase [Bradyrhizobium canariense]OSI19545.1 ATP-dependent DNA ligase [Bradyrhizobium canariense]OSI32366.1 ATP-dependent DNA ligase [Bradyrhizobium canariense]OSI42821.1 ATP-dependent DNA ligase [Bradyrhizobium canariense]OSI51099.1 ATP-dependent DNA ligase [Bradyrhizobium canariense]OSI59806.1 ATP-dependent DNA ligase [Bradyrhizobium canariense]